MDKQREVRGTGDGNTWAQAYHQDVNGAAQMRLDQIEGMGRGVMEKKTGSS